MGIDIDAGRAAGMKTAGVLTGFETQAQLLARHPDVVLSSIEHLPQILKLSEPLLS